MRILGIDHGTKRIGIAVSDELKMIAQPLEYIPAEPFAGVLKRLKELLQEKEIELMLIGMPRNMDGSYGPAALKVQDFAGALRALATAKPVVDRYFDDVMVMVDDPVIRANRLALLRSVAATMNRVADISKLAQ